ncbi:MAG TPA: hypothetical protein VF043_26295 [Ktedonobacteraceae bacterium]
MVIVLPPQVAQAAASQIPVYHPHSLQETYYYETPVPLTDDEEELLDPKLLLLLVLLELLELLLEVLLELVELLLEVLLELLEDEPVAGVVCVLLDVWLVVAMAWW